MNKSKYFSTFTLFLAIMLITGCSKKQEVSKSHKSNHSKTKTLSTHHNEVKAFDLDNDAMQTFALDDKLDQHQQSHSQSTKSHKKLFEWENLAADESKDSFKKLPFEFDSYILQPKQLGDLKSNAKLAKKMTKQGKTIVCEGHACHSAGSAIYNLALSEKRARHVATKLADAGIDSKKIKIAPRGQEMPIQKGGNRAEQAVNRRVEVFAIDSN